MSELHLAILGVRVTFVTSEPGALDPVRAFFGAFSVEDNTQPASGDLTYQVGPGCRVRRGQALDEDCRSLTRLLYVIDKDLTIELEHRRPDLYFLHAAAVECPAGVIVIAGDSGNGKSTTCWALTQHGFGYLSDELAPIDPEDYMIESFPRAIGLKSAPPAPYILPEDVLVTERTVHVPAEHLPAIGAGERRPLAALMFVRYSPELDAPEMTQISAGEAAARLYTHALNPLAHPNDGLAVATRIAGHCPARELRTADLAASCELVRAFAEALT